MEINNKLIDKIANMAKLNLSENESKNMKEDLRKITQWIKKIDKLDTENIEPLVSLSTESNILRDDNPLPKDSKEEILKNAPEKDSNYFKVPNFVSKSDQ